MVYYWQRHNSAVDFIQTARLLKIQICRSCAGANHKKFTFYGLQKLAEYSCELPRLTIQANAILPTNRHEYEARRLLLKRAMGMLLTLSAQFGDVDDLIGFSDGVKQTCSELMEKEEKLLKGILESDKKRFGKLV